MQSRTVMTRTLQAELCRLADPAPVVAVLSEAFRQIGGFEQEPSMVFAGPKYAERRLDDEGRSVLLPCPLAFYLKRDDYPPGCDPAMPDGGPVFTYMLPEDY
jgi:hypothetical protein